MNRQIYRIGSLRLFFSSYGREAFWNTWKWKLDPYRVSGAQEENDLEISMEIQDKEEKQGRLLRQTPADFFRHSVFEGNERSTIWRYDRIKNGDVMIEYRVSEKWDKIQLLKDNSRTAGHLAFEYLAQIMPGIYLSYNTLTFHGVLMEYQGHGVILSAFSGTGKTTHARLWRDEKNALIINGDRSTCWKINGRWQGFGLPWSGTSGEQINRQVPLSALVLLEQDSVNQAHSVKPEDSLRLLLPHLQYPCWDGELTGKAMELLDDFLREVPVFLLRCRPDKAAVEVLEQALEAGWRNNTHPIRF